MLAAVWRQTFEPDDARRASLGALLVGLGLLHLMMRRHVRRAPIAWARWASGSSCSPRPRAPWTSRTRARPRAARCWRQHSAITIVTRIADARERYAGSPFVTDAHELQD